MQNFENKNKQWTMYLCAALLTSIITLFAFWANQIYPFGTFSVASGDMINSTLPMISRFQDVIFNNSSIFYDFSAGAGTNMFLINSTTRNPFSLISLFLKQDNLFLSLSVIVFIRVLLCSITSAICLSNCFDTLDCLWISLLSTIYATSGFMTFSYFIPSWIDSMIMFPLVVLGLKQIIFKKKSTVYIISLALSLIISYYTTILAMILTFIFSAVVFLSLGRDKSEVKQVILIYGMSTLFAVLLSSIVILPNLVGVNESARLNVSFLSVLSSDRYFLQKLNYLFFSSSVIFVFICFFIKYYIKLPRTSIILCLLILLVPIFFEGSNLLLHMGSYQSYPFRAGFVYIYLIILIIGYIKNQNLTESLIVHKKSAQVIYLLLISICLVICFFATKSIKGGNISAIKFFDSQQSTQIKHTIVLFIGFGLAIFFSFLLTNKKLSLAVLSIIIVAQCCTSTYILFDPLRKDSKEYKVYLHQYEEARDFFKSSYYFRVKDAQSNLKNMNTHMLYNINSVGLYSSSTPYTTTRYLRTLGYSVEHMQPTDMGGTLFTDSLMGYKYLLSKSDLDSSFYAMQEELLKLNLYSNKSYVPIGMILPFSTIEGFDKVGDDYNGTVFHYQNEMFTSLGYEENLFEIFDYSEAEISGLNIKIDANKKKQIHFSGDASGHVTFTIPIVGKKQVYLDLLASADINTLNSRAYNRTKIYLNDSIEPLRTSTLKINTTYFPTAWNSGLLNLGEYENETLKVKIEFEKSSVLKNIAIGAMDIKSYSKFLNDYANRMESANVHRNKMNIELTDAKEGIAFIPLMFSEGLSAKVDGESTPIVKVFGNFVGVKVNCSNKNVAITYYPPGFKVGVVISLITLIALVICKITPKVNLRNKYGYIATICFYAYCILYSFIVTFIYLIPIVYKLFKMLEISSLFK